MEEVKGQKARQSGLLTYLSFYFSISYSTTHLSSYFFNNLFFSDFIFTNPLVLLLLQSQGHDFVIGEDNWVEVKRLRDAVVDYVIRGRVIRHRAN